MNLNKVPNAARIFLLNNTHTINNSEYGLNLALGRIFVLENKSTDLTDLFRQTRASIKVRKVV